MFELLSAYRKVKSVWCVWRQI